MTKNKLYIIRHTNTNKYFVEGKDFVADTKEEASRMDAKAALHIQAIFHYSTPYRVVLMPVDEREAAPTPYAVKPYRPR